MRFPPFITKAYGLLQYFFRAACVNTVSPARPAA